MAIRHACSDPALPSRRLPRQQSGSASPPSPTTPVPMRGMNRAMTPTRRPVTIGEEWEDRTVREVQVKEVWELQRRSTLFHSDWRAPFLPHDGLKQKRWVALDAGADYSQHPWIRVNQEVAGEVNEPPTTLPDGWILQKRWGVVKPPGEHDEQGWQYAVDFYIAGSNYAASPAFCHCRRRLWRCIASSPSLNMELLSSQVGMEDFLSTALTKTISSPAMFSPGGSTVLGSEPSPSDVSTVDELMPEEEWLGGTRVLQEDVAGLSLVAELSALLSDDWVEANCVLVEFLNSQGAMNLCVEQWKQVGIPGGAPWIREGSAEMPLPPKPMCPPTAQVKFKWEIRYVEGPRESAPIITIRTETLTLGMPFCNDYHVEDRLRFTSAATPDAVLVSKDFRLVWKNENWLKKVIESTATSAALDSAPAISSVLRRRATDGIECSLTIVVELWELQRRYFMMKDWTSPFLLHDADKKWRWVGLDYKKHPWVVCSQLEAAAASCPPVVPPEGMCLDRRGWCVVPPKRHDLPEAGEVPVPSAFDCVRMQPLMMPDKEGWEYAHDLYQSDGLYYDVGGDLLFCRRRRWRAVFVQPGPVSSQPIERAKGKRWTIPSCAACGVSPRTLADGVRRLFCRQGAGTARPLIIE